MIIKLFGFLKANVVNLILLGVISLVAFYAHQVSSMAKQVDQLSKDNATLSLSVSNIESDKDKLKLALDSEKSLRQHLEKSIKKNEKRLNDYLGALDSIKENENQKVVTLENTAQSFSDKDCINTTMPSSIVGLFKRTKTD